MLYGLKQEPNAWYTRINNYFTKFGFTKSEEDANIYHIMVEGKLFIIALYVDDSILTVDEKLVKSCKKDLVGEFKMKDLGLMHYSLVWKYGKEMGNCLSGKVFQLDIEEVPHGEQQTHGDSSSGKLEEGRFYFR